MDDTAPCRWKTRERLRFADGDARGGDVHRGAPRQRHQRARVRQRVLGQRGDGSTRERDGVARADDEAGPLRGSHAAASRGCRRRAARLERRVGFDSRYFRRRVGIL